MNNAQITKILTAELKKIDPKIRITPNQTLTILYVDLYSAKDIEASAEAISAVADSDSRISWEKIGKGGDIHLPQEPKTIREVYDEKDEAGQLEMDRSWLRMGGHLSEEKMDRLVEAGLIGPWR